MVLFMKKLLLFSLILLFTANILFAREYRTINHSMGIGPLVAYRLGVNTVEPPNGFKNGVGTAAMPDLGLSFYMPLNPDDKMGLIIDAYYANYAYLTKFNNTSVDWTDRFTYISVEPKFYISGFTIGLGIGFPSSAERVYSDRSLEINSSTLATVFDLKIGGHFTMNESELGRLCLFVTGSYQINGQYSDDANLGSLNPHPASLQVGLSYIFNMD